MEIPKALIKKKIAFNFSSQKLRFECNQSLFSSARIDTGTQALLNSMRKNESLNLNKILDLGCGYGPIGIFLKKQDETREVHCADRDLLATEFATHNALLNDVQVKTIGTLGYSNITEKYTTIVSNIPAKIGPRAIKELIFSASRHLEQDGQFVFVIVKEYEALIKTLLEETSIATKYFERKKGHLIWHLPYTKELAPVENPYQKGALFLPIRQPNRIETSYSIPEFDTLSYSTNALAKLLKRVSIPKNINFIEPNQGAGVILASEIGKLQKIHLFSRDILRLTTVQKAIHDTEIEVDVVEHAEPWIQEQLDGLTVLSIHHKNDRAVNAQILSQVSGHAIIYGPRPACKDFLERGEVIDFEEIRHHGAYYLRLGR